MDVPATVTITEAVGGSKASLTIPAGFDVAAHDGLPLWLERGTTMYVDRDDGTLGYAGLVSYSAPARKDRKVESGDALSMYDLMVYENRLFAWQPHPYDVVDHLLAAAHAQPHGTFQVSLERLGDPTVLFVGDVMPPTPRPEKPPQNFGESEAAYEVRVSAWEDAAAAWDALYGDRKPYVLTYLDWAYIGAEIRRIMETIPFEVVEKHEWIAPLEPSHKLQASATLGVARSDIKLVEGVNLIGDIAPATSSDVFGNDIWVVGGDNWRPDKKSGRATVVDSRVRTTRLFEDRTIKNKKQLTARAEQLLAIAQQPAPAIMSAVASERSLPGLRPGDTIGIETSIYEGTARVLEFSWSTAGGPISLNFDVGNTR